MKVNCVLLTVLFGMACAALADAEPKWHDQLSYDGGGYWTVRVRVEVDNPSDEPLAGAPARLVLGEEGPTSGLLGQRVEGIRAVTEGGTELLYGVVDKEGADKRSGPLAVGDAVVLPVEAASRATVALYVYAGNDAAWAPPAGRHPERLRAGLVNPGFEKGADMPEHWTQTGTDASHRMALQRENAHTGSACARCDVDARSAPAWVQYRQGGIPVVPGRTYRFSAWVKAENVQGKAGWYVHVNGSEPRVVNLTKAWDGTFDWRKVTIEFEVPEGGEFFFCGTMLHGTGTAWYDDAALESESVESPLAPRAGPVQTCELRSAGGSGPWAAEEQWQWRAPLYVRNFSDHALDNCAVLFDTRRVRNRIGKLLGFTATPCLRIVDPGAPERLIPRKGTLGDEIRVVTEARPHTEKVLWMYVGEAREGSEREQAATVAGWATSETNLLANGSMETGDGERPAAWHTGEEGREAEGRFEPRRVPGGVHGDWCARIDVPASVAEPGWIGWRQRVSVKPGARYLLAGYVKTEDMDSPVQINGHFYRADGSRTEKPFFSTRPTVPQGDHDWVRTSTIVVTPADCAAIEVHLTMNGHGTLWHDAVVLMEAAWGTVGAIEARDPQQEKLAGWVVNPLVKVFRDDLPPRQAAREVSAWASRNSREAVQIAVRAGDQIPLHVAVTALEGPGGARLEPVEVYRAGFVPIDFPIGYDSKTEPTYHRLAPARRGNDGWAGWWPDPLVRVENGLVALEHGQTQPLWLDISVPASATPGDYEGAVSLSSKDTSLRIPVHLTVWDFVQPEEKHLPALYDLRNGPGWNIFDAPDRAEAICNWYCFLARYNVSPGFVIDPPVFTYEDGRVSMDAEQFDELAHYLLDDLHVNKVYTPNIFYACGWAYRPKTLFELEPFTDAYVQAWTGAYRMFVDHVTENGWRDKFVFYLSDEPHEHSDVTITGLARIADMAKEVAPDMPVYSSTWRYIEGLEGHLTLWGIGPQGTFPEEKIAERRAAGDRFWFTTDGQMCTDTPFLAIERLLPWFCLKYDVEGYEFWGVSWWTHNPWDYGWHTYIRQSSEGENWFRVRYPNGDGFLTYPLGDGQYLPAPTIRLIAAREGVDDYEVFLALSRFAEQGNADAQRALDRVRGLVAMPNRGGRCSTDIMPDPDAVQAARIAVGDTLSRLVRSSAGVSPATQ